LDGGTLIIGMMALVAASALVADVGRRVARRWWPDDALTRLTAAFVVGLSTTVVVLEVLGTASLLQPAVVLAAIVTVWLVARSVLGPPPPSAGGGGSTNERSLWRLGALAAVGVLGMLILGSIVFSLMQPRPEFDAVSFHLPVAAQWFQHGNTRIFPYETPVSLSAHYPGNFELMGLWLLIPVGRDFLVQLASLPALALLAV
jgi:hypothetical protein